MLHSLERTTYDDVVSDYFRINSFSDYLLDVYEHGFWDKHQLPQTNYIVDDINDVVLFSLENLENLLPWLGVEDKEIPHERQRPEKITLTDQDKEIIKEIYADDFLVWHMLNI